MRILNKQGRAKERLSRTQHTHRGATIIFVRILDLYAFHYQFPWINVFSSHETYLTVWLLNNIVVICLNFKRFQDWIFKGFEIWGKQIFFPWEKISLKPIEFLKWYLVFPCLYEKPAIVIQIVCMDVWFDILYIADT